MHAADPTLIDILGNVDYSMLVIAVLTNLGTKVVVNEIYLSRKFNSKTKDIIKTPKVKAQTDILEDDEILKRYGEKVLHFKNVLKGELKPKNLTLFYNNIETLEINLNVDKKNVNKLVVANYKIDTNSINIYEDDKHNLYHELLHMSSRLDASFNGFYQSNNNIGKGINEGYTEILCDRYFGKSEESKSYVIEKHIASNLEKIVGQEKMEDYYFTSDLYSLSKELELYLSKEEVTSFFQSLDFVNYFIRRAIFSVTIKNKLDRSIKNIYYLLAKMWMLKCKKDYESGSINIFVYLIVTKKYVSELNVLISNRYQSFNSKTLKKLYDECGINNP